MGGAGDGPHRGGGWQGGTGGGGPPPYPPPPHGAVMTVEEIPATATGDGGEEDLEVQVAARQCVSVCHTRRQQMQSTTTYS